MIRRGESDRPRALVGVRIDWLCVAFRVRFPSHKLEELEERVKIARKHGAAACDFAGDLWQAQAPKAVSWWLISEVRAERLEVAAVAPGSYVTALGEVVPGWTLALHASSVKLAITGTRKALERGWWIARRAGEVFEARARRIDATADFRGVLLGQVDEAGWRPVHNVGVTKELDGGKDHVRNADRRSLFPEPERAGDDERPSGTHVRRLDEKLTLFEKRPRDGLDVRARRRP